MQMSLNSAILFTLLFFTSCSSGKWNDAVEGHWHCTGPKHYGHYTIDIADSTIIGDKFLVGSYIHVQRISPDITVQADGDSLVLREGDSTFHFYRSDISKCLASDRYRNSMIDLSLPEVSSARSFEISVRDYTTGDILIGKLKQGSHEALNRLAKLYPDSVFIQVNDMLVTYGKIPEYIQDLKDCLDCPKASINLHVDKEVPEGVVATVVNLINPSGYTSTRIYNVVRIKNGDIGLLRRY